MKHFFVREDGSIGEEISGAEVTENSCFADFSLEENGQATLLRWPRNTRKAVVPEYVLQHRVVRIAPLAFASFHFPDAVWSGFTGSFSVFCIMNAGKRTEEKADEGGPTEIRLPEGLEEIGQYAFWHCDRLERIRIPSGIRRLREGTFGECGRLSRVGLTDGLEEIGRFFAHTVQIMPDVGTFSGCHSLKKLILPKTVMGIGAEVFNSCGLEELIAEDDCCEASPACWSRKINVHPSAFEHAAALQWMGRKAGGELAWQIGLPAAMDKILSCDSRYRIILRLPYLFFELEPEQIDAIAKNAFRLDFSGRMAIARLRCPALLKPDMRDWYLSVLIEYFDRLEQFWPESENRPEEAFALLKDSSGFTAELLGKLMYIAGRAHMKTDLIYSMMELRNQRFSGITGLESLEL